MKLIPLDLLTTAPMRGQRVRVWNADGPRTTTFEGAVVDYTGCSAGTVRVIRRDGEIVKAVWPNCEAL